MKESVESCKSRHGQGFLQSSSRLHDGSGSLPLWRSSCVREREKEENLLMVNGSTKGLQNSQDDSWSEEEREDSLTANMTLSTFNLA